MTCFYRVKEERNLCPQGSYRGDSCADVHGPQDICTHPGRARDTVVTMALRHPRKSTHLSCHPSHAQNPNSAKSASSSSETMQGADANHSGWSSGRLVAQLQRPSWWSSPRGLSQLEDKATGTGLPVNHHNHEAFRCGGTLASRRGVDPG